MAILKTKLYPTVEELDKTSHKKNDLTITSDLSKVKDPEDAPTGSNEGPFDPPPIEF